MKSVVLCGAQILAVAICTVGATAGLAREADDPGTPAATQPETTDSPSILLLRPMSSIGLATSISSISLTGEALPEPFDTAGQLPGSRLVERQYIGAPWSNGHPPRNTYPICYQPLYFEDPNMERCGHSCGCLTELMSAVHFAGRIPALPYLIASSPPHDCVRSLPDCPTCSAFGPEAYWPAPSIHASAFQAAATVGLIFLIP